MAGGDSTDGGPESLCECWSVISANSVSPSSNSAGRSMVLKPVTSTESQVLSLLGGEAMSGVVGA